MRRRSASALAVALVAGLAACGNKDSTSATAAKPAPGSASAAGSAAPAGSASAAGSAAPAAPVAKLDPGALDAALAARSLAGDAVKQRATTPRSAWAIAASKRDEHGDALEFDVVRVRAGGAVDELRLTPPPAPDAPVPPDFAEVVSFEVRDLDGDGVDEGVLVADWQRTTMAPPDKHCRECSMSTGEEAKQLYVIRGTGALAIAFTHVVSYTTETDGNPPPGAPPFADPENVAYEWKIADGNPATLELTRTDNQVATQKRLAGVLDPASDPLFSAGAHQSVQLQLK
jgi:hypothetical protein